MLDCDSSPLGKIGVLEQLSVCGDCERVWSEVMKGYSIRVEFQLYLIRL